MNMLFFGDSICYGDGVRPAQAWVTLVKERFAQEHSSATQFTNGGVNGDTSAGAVERMSFWIETYKPDLLYIQFGLNDSWSGEVNLPDYLHNIQIICDYALKHGVKKLLVANNHPVCPENIFYSFGTPEFKANVLLYNQALRSNFESNKLVKFVDIEQAFIKDKDAAAQGALLQEDGVHLSVTGNIFYCNLLYPVLKNMA